MRNPQLIKLVPFVFVLLWSTGFIGARYAMPYAEPFTLLGIRMAIAAGLIALLSTVIRTTWPSPRLALHSAVAGILIHAVYLGGVFAAIKLGMPAGTTALIVGMQPLLTAMLAAVWLSEHVRLQQGIGLALGLVGIVLVIGVPQDSSGITGAGIVLAVCSLVGICVGALYQKRFCSNTSLLAGTFYQYAASSVLLAVMAFTLETREITWTPTLALALVWLVLVLSLAAILLLMLMIREGQATTVASYFYLTPPVTAIMAWLLFDETLSALAIAGMVTASAGVYLARAR